MLDFKRLEELVEQAKLEAKSEKMKPNPLNGDNDSDGIDPNELGF